MPWYRLKGVRNRSIQKTTKYRHEIKLNQRFPDTLREELEEISRKFDLKYLLAIMNSNFALNFFNRIRKGDTDILPDEWKRLPIAQISMEEQLEFVDLVDYIVSELKKWGYPLPSIAVRRISELEAEIDKRLAELYGMELI